MGGHGDFLKPLPLSDHRFLNVQISLELRPNREGRDMWQVMQSRFQYQTDDGSRSSNWIFRYDYLRQPASAETEAVRRMIPHLNVNGPSDVIDEPHLSKVHFPTRRMSLESVIRLLLTDFKVSPYLNPAVWGPMLGESERMFLEIAHEDPPPR
jgi:hypothetical protein